MGAVTPCISCRLRPFREAGFGSPFGDCLNVRPVGTSVSMRPASCPMSSLTLWRGMVVVGAWR